MSPAALWLQAKSRIRHLLLRTRSVPLPAALRERWFLYEILIGGRTMVSPIRLRHLYRLCSDPRLPAGAMVECGVARGGCLAVMAYAGGRGRQVYGFDSFEGMPPLGEKDENDGARWVGFKASGPRGQAEAQMTLEQYGLDNVRLVKGWFDQTLPGHAATIGPIAVLRLDNDWYESTLLCLELLYPLVVPGGAVIIDDYHTFIGCRKAVDEYRQRQGIAAPLVTTEADSEVVWRKD